MRAFHSGDSAPTTQAPAAISLPVLDAMPAKTFPLTALLPQKWLSEATGERVRVQGSPGFQVVFVSVDSEVVAIPLDVAIPVLQAAIEHARSAQLRAFAYLQRTQ